ncbi:MULTISPECIES: LysR family transcriptional regulator [Silvimonas]|uniref:LysR family transcriptional regulator n=1 Tax=Silvimonas TaxID=300264 RepID=UPI0024B35199|nr:MULTISPECIES: LysR family transcriptional regulator [Silvimonas]MDR3426575.1 LysR substrate-binding domain-containing protein [Silvimonas sp.]
MELRQLRYFVAVAEELHFGRAAERLEMTQPPLSQQIQALEQDMGVRLFNRTNRRVELTQAGRSFLNDARLILKQLDQAVEQAVRAHRGQSGELRLGITGSAPFTAVFARSIHDFRESHPAVQLTLREMTTPHQIDALMERRLDIGVIRPIAVPDALQIIELLQEPLVIAMHTSHPAAQGDPAVPVSLEQFAHDGFVMFPRGIGITLAEQVWHLCRDAGFTPNIVQEARETSTQIALIAAGFGVGIMPALQQRIQVETVAYRTIDHPAARTAVWLVHRRESQPALVQAFLERVRDEVRRTRAADASGAAAAWVSP